MYIQKFMSGKQLNISQLTIRDKEWEQGYDKDFKITDVISTHYTQPCLKILSDKV